jgi:hypothetical protein
MKQFTKSSGIDISPRLPPLVSAVVPESPNSKRSARSVVSTARPFTAVPDSLMGMASPSHSVKGSFGPKTRTRSRCPMKTSFPGPGHYAVRYATVVLPSSRR